MVCRDGHQLEPAGLSATAEYNEFQETVGGLGGPVMSCQGTVLSHAYRTLWQ